MKSVIILMLLCLAAGFAKAADSVYIHANGEIYYLQVDTTQVVIDWVPYDGPFDGDDYLSAHPYIDPVDIEFDVIGDFARHRLTGSYYYDTVLSNLETDPNIVRYNKVTDAGDGLSSYMGDIVICKFHLSVDSSFIDSVCQVHQLELLGESQYISNQFTIRLTPECPQSTLDVANMFAELSEVDHCQPDGVGADMPFGYSVVDVYFSNR